MVAVDHGNGAALTLDTLTGYPRLLVQIDGQRYTALTTEIRALMSAGRRAIVLGEDVPLTPVSGATPV